MIDYIKKIFLCIAVFIIILSGCVFDRESVDQIDYGNGFYFQWYTYIGDSGSTQKVTEISHDSKDNIYILGTSDSSLDSKYGNPLNPWSEINKNLLIKMNSDGIVLWHTFLPGIDYKIKINNMDQIVLSGETEQDFVLAGLNPIHSYHGNRDVCLININSEGEINWYTFLGGAFNDSNTCIEVDQKGNIFLLGYSLGDWSTEFGTPVLPHTEGNNFAAKITDKGKIDSYTHLDTVGVNIKSGSISVDPNNSVYLSLHYYSGHHELWIFLNLNSNFEQISSDKKMIGYLYNLLDNGYLSYYRSGRLFYGYDEEKFEFNKFDSDLNLVWTYGIINEGDKPNKYATLNIHSLKVDNKDNIYFIGDNAGRLLQEYYEVPIISPLLTELDESFNTIYKRKILVKISKDGRPEWYSYLGHPSEVAFTPYSLTVTDDETIYVAENNRNFLWPEIYNLPIDTYETNKGQASDDNSTILIAKFQNNPEFLKIRIYEKIYKKLIVLRKKTYIKLDYSIALESGYSDEEYTFSLYKFDNEEKQWVEIDNHKNTGQYTFKDKHVHQSDFNHYKVTAYNRLGEKIAESRIISVYPPNPYLNEVED